jgi:hypothetical protein
MVFTWTPLAPKGDVKAYAHNVQEMVLGKAAGLALHGCVCPGADHHVSYSFCGSRPLSLHRFSSVLHISLTSWRLTTGVFLWPKVMLIILSGETTCFYDVAAAQGGLIWA